MYRFTRRILTYSTLITRRSIQTSCENVESSPLKGIRIIDLTRIVAGPFCTMILSDMGAEVLKIERIGSGDECRKWGPPFINNSQESSYFMAVNRNKKSICVDLKQPEGKNILYELSKKSDVLVENYIPGKLDELKLGYDDFYKISPHLIYCSITGYGSEGPYKHRPGYDVIAASMGGLLHCTGYKDGGPVKVGVAITDMTTGLFAHGAILAALIKRSRTGKGQKIDCNLLSTQVATLNNLGSNYLNNGQDARRWGTSHETIAPYEAFPTKDGYFTVGTGSDSQYKDFCQRIGNPELAENKQFLTNKLRVENRNELLPIIRNVMKSKSKKEWEIIFEGASFPCGPVNNLEETFNDPHIKEIDIVKTVDHAVAGKVKVVGPPVKFSEGGNFVRSAPPALGQHTTEVLSNILGYDKQDIENLISKKIVQ